MRLGGRQQPRRPPQRLHPGSPFMQTLSNFVAGMVVASVFFLYQLPSLIWSYQPALVSAGAGAQPGQ